MDYLDNFVHKFICLSFESVCYIDEVIYSDQQKYNVDSMAWDHYFETTIARRDILPNN